MQKVQHVITTVLPDDNVEFASPELESGQTVDVVCCTSPKRRAAPSWKSSTAARSIVCFSRPKR